MMTASAPIRSDRGSHHQTGQRHHGGDFIGTSPQVKGSINLPIAMTQSSCPACLRSVIDPNLPTTPLHAADHGDCAARLHDPISPAPAAARGLTSMRVTEAVGRAGPDAAEQGFRLRGAGRFWCHHRGLSRGSAALRVAGIPVRHLGRAARQGRHRRAVVAGGELFQHAGGSAWWSANSPSASSNTPCARFRGAGSPAAAWGWCGSIS